MVLSVMLAPRLSCELDRSLAPRLSGELDRPLAPRLSGELDRPLAPRLSGELDRPLAARLSGELIDRPPAQLVVVFYYSPSLQQRKITPRNNGKLQTFIAYVAPTNCICVKA